MDTLLRIVNGVARAGYCMEQLISATNQIITVFWWQESSAAFTPGTIQDVVARAPSLLRDAPWWQTKWLFVALSSPSLADAGGWAGMGGQNANSWVVLQTINRRSFHNHGELLQEKALTSAFTFNTILRHCAKQVLTPRGSWDANTIIVRDGRLYESLLTSKVF